MEDFHDVCDPSKLPSTTPTRSAMYQIEKDISKATRHEIKDNARNFEELISAAERLAEQTKQNVDIQQEDHGKVLLVFTIVTIVFSPLSFVTSLFGMNTVDIRSTDSTQAPFWATALPLTAIVVALSLLIGFKGYEIREALEKRSWAKRSPEPGDTGSEDARRNEVFSVDRSFSPRRAGRFRFRAIFGSQDVRSEYAWSDETNSVIQRISPHRGLRFSFPAVFRRQDARSEYARSDEAVSMDRPVSPRRTRKVGFRAGFGRDSETARSLQV